MPSSLYRLAGKPHHAEVTATVSVPPIMGDVTDTSPAADRVEISSAVEEAVTPDPTPAPALEKIEVVPTVETASSVDAVEATTIYPTWDPGWTKAKLLEVAASLNLSVTVENTKAQIIAALTEATSS